MSLNTLSPTEIRAISFLDTSKSNTHLLKLKGGCLNEISGYHLGVVNGALEYLAKDLGIAENAVLQGWIVSTVLAGVTVGSFTRGSLADQFGRTKTFILDAIPLTIGPFLCATARNVQTMIIGRLLAGIGISISSAIVPLYISEISPTEIRGTLGSINQLFIYVGILVALVAGLPLTANHLWWRTMFAISAIPSVLLALGMTFSPESHRWLVQQKKVAQAEKAIKTLYAKTADISVSVPPAPPEAPQLSTRKNNMTGRWSSIGLVSGLISLLVLLVLLIFWAWRYNKRKKLRELERAADAGEALRMTRIGSMRTPFPLGTITIPNLESEFSV